jgi:hypothetical protein
MSERLTDFEEAAQNWADCCEGLSVHSPLSSQKVAEGLRYAARLIEIEWMDLPKTWSWCDMTSQVMHLIRQVRRVARHYRESGLEMAIARACEEENQDLEAFDDVESVLSGDESETADDCDAGNDGEPCVCETDAQPAGAWPELQATRTSCAH